MLWGNGFLMVYAREIAFHGLLIPSAASFAALMGGARWGWWTLAGASATWLAPLVMPLAGLPAPLDVVWPTQYLRLWFFHSSLAAGIVATIGHVTRYLEAAWSGAILCSNARTESRAVQALAGRVREAEENERRRLAHEVHDDFGQRLTALRMKPQLSRCDPTSAPPPSTTASRSPRSCCTTSARSPAACGRRCSTRSASARRSTRSSTRTSIGGVRRQRLGDRLPRLAAPIEPAVYRVVQEAIANSLRHAAASRLSLAARRDGDELAAWRIDDGRGFDRAWRRARRPASISAWSACASARSSPAAASRSTRHPDAARRSACASRAGRGADAAGPAPAVRLSHTVLLADDHTLVRAGLRALLEGCPRSRRCSRRATAARH